MGCIILPCRQGIPWLAECLKGLKVGGQAEGGETACTIEMH